MTNSKSTQRSNRLVRILRISAQILRVVSQLLILLKQIGDWFS